MMNDVKAWKAVCFHCLLVLLTKPCCFKAEIRKLNKKGLIRDKGKQHCCYHKLPPSLSSVACTPSFGTLFPPFSLQNAFLGS